MTKYIGLQHIFNFKNCVGGVNVYFYMTVKKNYTGGIYHALVIPRISEHNNIDHPVAAQD